MKYTLSLFTIFLFSFHLQSQVIGDALRYANTEVTGTARTLGLGGAIGALGSDFSAISLNPAGLGWYRKSELVFTPSLDLSEVDSELVGGNNRTRNASRLDFSNMGLVIKGRNRSGSALRSLNFAVGFNSTANYYQDAQFSGNTPGSITDRFLELTSDGNDNTPNLRPDELDNFEAGLAYEAGALLSSQNSEGEYFYSTDFAPREITEKSQINQATGGINELAFSLAGNVEEKLLIGATIGIPIIRYQEIKTYREKDEDGSNAIFEELEFTERLTQTGAGINAKLGFIYRAVHAVRLGLAVHTPTTFSIEDNFSSSLSYSYNDNGIQSFTADSPEGNFDYRVTTPMSIIGSSAFILGKMGLLTAEVEWKDYSKTSFNFNSTSDIDDLDYEALLNEQIVETYKSAVNLRFGGEFAYNKFRIRAGYGLLGSPYMEGKSFYNSFSAGIGVRERVFYADIGYRHSTFGETYAPYVTFDQELRPQQEVLNDITNNTFLLTFGFRF